MTKVREGRVLSGGLAAGVVLVLGFLLFERVFSVRILGATFGAPPIAELPTERIAWYLIGHVLVGVALVWFYAAIRPRFGPGAGTAIRAAIALWFVAVAIPSWFQVLLGTVRPSILGGEMLTTLFASGVAFVAATLVGAWMYREPAAEPGIVSVASEPI